jgi:hypothetical protein
MLRHAAHGRNPPEERLTDRGDLYLKIHIYKRQTFMPPEDFEPTIQASQRL